MSPRHKTTPPREAAYYAALGALIKSQMKRSGLTQAQLAGAIGLKNQSGVSRIFSGKQKTDAEQLARIAVALGVSVETLLPPEGPDEFRQEALGRPAGVLNGVSGPDRSLPAKPLPASYREFFDAHPRLHPAIKAHMANNPDLRTESWVDRDDAESLMALAIYFAKRLKVPLDVEGGAEGGGAARPSKG